MNVLTDFRHLRPRYEIGQEQVLRWVADAHGAAAGSAEVAEQIHERLQQLGFGPERIATRGTQMRDCFHTEWEQMEIYPVTRLSAGVGHRERSQFFDREVSQVFEQLYPPETPLPPHITHVTCTGYVAPSPAQKLVSARQAGQNTVVTHAYHMGCYASIPAIRMAQPGTDIVHTELCSLHMHPMRHTTDQLVVQGLFADGFIRYHVTDSCTGPHLRIVALREETIPNSTQAMSWQCEDHGLGMKLSKEVPVLIARSIHGYLERLCGSQWKSALFAVHPGGPKILTQIQELLELEPHQMAHSIEVLRRYGNMSSATLPHIWEMMLNDPEVPSTSIISLAFGPGLTIAGGLFEKR